MKQGKLVSLIKEVVKQEVKKQVTDILINETNIPKTKPVVKRKKVEEKNYTDNPTLNKILNETAQQQEEYPTLGGGTFDSSRATELLGYGGGLGNKEVKREVAAASTLQSAGMNPDTAPEHLKNALTRDYTDLVKAIDKKKGK
jgi:hypothetical protein|tara:strand:+ start:1453 stop:1881 length:429 start_codon:yes stop_codon:yes gene_type:complete